MRRRRNVVMGLVALAGFAAACGDGGTTGVIDEPPEVQPFVGTWEAEELTITSDADTSIVFDLFDYNGQFTLDIQPSGTYTAALSFRPDSANLFARSEIGTITVTGDALTLRPNGGEPATGSYSFLSDDRFELESPTDFDFNFDEDGDPAVLRATLTRN